MRSGILIALIGAWLVLRTVRKDATGRNLVDRLQGA
jgi:ABC-type nickel/cobalt efflux system permease component RcnA